MSHTAFWRLAAGSLATRGVAGSWAAVATRSWRVTRPLKPRFHLCLQSSTMRSLLTSPCTQWAVYFDRRCALHRATPRVRGMNGFRTIARRRGQWAKRLDGCRASTSSLERTAIRPSRRSEVSPRSCRCRDAPLGLWPFALRTFPHIRPFLAHQRGFGFFLGGRWLFEQCCPFLSHSHASRS